MKSIRTILLAATAAAIASCTYVEPAEPSGISSTTREATTTTVDHDTGESVTTQRRTTHYPNE
ncbi:hypothetical protein [Luteolibacter sp. Populi]|uniref:hypothetical protein n=1 Tax=Luteolibacter sp. Populi TaxID=3230487 RepID=UPI00346522D8